MAKQLNVNLAFTADTSQAKAQLQQLQNQLNSLVKGQGISDSHLGITQEIREGINAAAQLKVQLEAATNINTGKLDLNKFSRSLRQSGMDLKTYAKQLQLYKYAVEKSLGVKVEKTMLVSLKNAEFIELPS